MNKWSFLLLKVLLLALRTWSQFGATLSLRLFFNKVRAALGPTYLQATGLGLEFNKVVFHCVYF